jgi:hypothetical protein
MNVRFIIAVTTISRYCGVLLSYIILTPPHLKKMLT